MQSYLNFFNLKKAESLKEVELEFEEFKSKQVQGVIYNQEEVVGLIGDLEKAVQNLLNKEVSKMIYMSAVYVKIFLSVCAE